MQLLDCLYFQFLPEVMGTGSTPSYHPSSVHLGEDGQPHLLWKRHMVFGGTSISQHTEILVEEEGFRLMPVSADEGEGVP